MDRKKKAVQFFSSAILTAVCFIAAAQNTRADIIPVYCGSPNSAATANGLAACQNPPGNGLALGNNPMPGAPGVGYPGYLQGFQNNGNGTWGYFYALQVDSGTTLTQNQSFLTMYDVPGLTASIQPANLGVTTSNPNGNANPINCTSQVGGSPQCAGNSPPSSNILTPLNPSNGQIWYATIEPSGPTAPTGSTDSSSIYNITFWWAGATQTVTSTTFANAPLAFTSIDAPSTTPNVYFQSSNGGNGFILGPAANTAVPEPISMTLIGGALLGLGLFRKRAH
jgi:hypothetical protein